MDPATMAMLEEAAAAFMKDQATQAMGPELSSIGGLLGQTQAPAGTMPPAAPTPEPAGVMDTLKSNVMSDINKSTLGQAYNTVMNPNATAKDYTSLGYRLAFSPEAEKQNQSGMGQMSNMPTGGGYGGRVNTSGGIPDLLKQYNYNPGILQYLG